MTKQERLKQVIEEAVRPYLISGIKGGFETAILQALSDEGAVIKVERELPENPHRRSIEEEGEPDDEWNRRIAQSNIIIHDDAQQDMLKAGCVFVEPLMEVKDVDNNR